METPLDGDTPGWRHPWMETPLDGDTPGWKHPWIEHGTIIPYPMDSEILLNVLLSLYGR